MQVAEPRNHRLDARLHVVVRRRAEPVDAGQADRVADVDAGRGLSGLEAVLFMRSMDYIGISQTIGRVIRLHKDDAEALSGGRIAPGALQDYTKSFGLVCIPVYSSVGISTARKVQAVVDTVFNQGQPAISVVKR